MRHFYLPLFAILGLAAAPAAARDGQTRLYASLDGSSETTPNNSAGTGIFSARLDPASGELCYKLTSQNLALLTNAVIAAGNLGRAGPTVVKLLADSPHETCITIDRDLAGKIAGRARGYYVEIRTQTYTNGVIRGQLVK